ncbi:hypothetical protein Tco_0186224 [Tanacetum coccineum]
MKSKALFDVFVAAVHAYEIAYNVCFCLSQVSYDLRYVSREGGEGWHTYVSLGLFYYIGLFADILTASQFLELLSTTVKNKHIRKNLMVLQDINPYSKVITNNAIGPLPEYVHSQSADRVTDTDIVSVPLLNLWRFIYMKGVTIHEDDIFDALFFTFDNEKNVVTIVLFLWTMYVVYQVLVFQVLEKNQTFHVVNASQLVCILFVMFLLLVGIFEVHTTDTHTPVIGMIGLPRGRVGIQTMVLPADHVPGNGVSARYSEQLT